MQADIAFEESSAAEFSRAKLLLATGRTEVFVGNDAGTLIRHLKRYTL